MTRASRLLIVVAALLLGVLYFVPLWRIDLGAPQYPEGLGLRIWIDRIEGAGPNDLRNLNGINHYIGMRPIEPDQIAELGFMPAIVAFLLVTGLVVAAVGRRGLFFGWLAVFAFVALAGLVDFWKWGYDYGHDLDPTAAIKVPGMAYQPPLVGSKQLLNFHTTSWPDLGGIAAFLSLTLALGVGLRELRRRRLARAGALPAAAAAAVAVACAAPSPRSVAYGTDECAHCHMTVADHRFTAQLVTRTGKTFVFDDPGCLAEFLDDVGVEPAAVHSLWLADYTAAGERLLPADSALLVRSPEIRAPMASRLAAVPDGRTADSLQAELGGEILRWADVTSRLGARS